ncbi:MAG: ShlB/FhaC/HecB family hemolysin secretion/activation protein [Microcoleaceae cyanobacterium]
MKIYCYTTHFILSFFFVYFNYSQSAISQTLPQPIIPDSPPLDEPELLPPPEELLQPLPAPQTPEESILEIPGTIIVTEFNFVGSTVFTNQQLQTIIQDYLNRPISFTELLEAQQKITQFYQDQGYITSGAILPPQTLDAGRITIEIIEGTVEEIQISGLERLHSGYIRSRIERGIKAPLNQNKLLETLQLLQLNPLIKRLSVELSAGSQIGQSQLIIQLEEADAMSAKLAIDNQRSPSVGSTRLLSEITHNNLTGLGDRLNVSYYNTEGSNTLNNFSYTLPINSNNATISLTHRRTESHIIEAPFNELDIDSNSQTYQLSYRQPLYLTPNTEFAIGITAAIQDTETLLENEPFPLSLGANDQGKIRTSVIRLFQDYSTRSAQTALAIRSQFSFGTELFNATINNNLPDSRFIAWRGQIQYLRLLAPNFIWLLRSDLQLANQSLLPQEQFSLGGASTIRGYRQDTLLGDNGVFLSTELRVPIFTISDWNMVVQLTPFIDGGTVWNQEKMEDIDLDYNTIFSTGLGLRLQIQDNLNAQIEWGIPLIKLETEGESLQENGVHFLIQYQVNF